MREAESFLQRKHLPAHLVITIQVVFPLEDSAQLDPLSEIVRAFPV